MTTFTIYETNEIVAFATPEEASAATTTPFDSFTSEQELAQLAAACHRSRDSPYPRRPLGTPNTTARRAGFGDDADGTTGQ
jgi:hypothetical protein